MYAAHGYAAHKRYKYRHHMPGNGHRAAHGYAAHKRYKKPASHAGEWTKEKNAPKDVF